MNGQQKNNSAELVHKIASLVEERGWNQEDFVRRTGLNRQTVHEVLERKADRRLRNATISRCAAALGLPVSTLRELPFEELLKCARPSSGRDETESLPEKGKMICKIRRSILSKFPFGHALSILKIRAEWVGSAFLNWLEHF